jgi:hypothetical protein
MPAFRIAPCSEYPNDNPGLHRGAIWRCVEVGVDASFELPDDPVKDEPCLENPYTELTEIVEELSFEDAVDEHLDSSPLASEPSSPVEEPARTALPSDPFASFVLVLEDVAIASGADDRARNNLRAYLGEMSVDGVDADDRAVAWQGILRGESEDFGPCGSATLDEWAADLVARALGNASRAAGIRRDLRQRGVAAFGFVADAA